MRNTLSAFSMIRLIVLVGTFPSSVTINADPVLTTFPLTIVNVWPAEINAAAPSTVRDTQRIEAKSSHLSNSRESGAGLFLGCWIKISGGMNPQSVAKPRTAQPCHCRCGSVGDQPRQIQGSRFSPK